MSHESGVVISQDGKLVTLAPPSLHMCINCNNSQCRQSGSRFIAVNNHNLPLLPGTKVTISVSYLQLVVQIIFGVIVPIVLATVAYCISGRMVQNMALSSGIAVITLFIAGGVFALLTRILSPTIPEITGILP